MFDHQISNDGTDIVNFQKYVSPTFNSKKDLNTKNENQLKMENDGSPTLVNIKVRGNNLKD